MLIEEARGNASPNTPVKGFRDELELDAIRQMVVGDSCETKYQRQAGD